MRLLILLALAAAPVLAEPPRIVSMTPDNGDTGVDPALAEIRVEFDQDMSQESQSICGGGELFPKMTARARWDSARVIVLPVRLEANHVYVLSINCPSFRSFRGLKGGESAEITPLWFRTGDGAAATPPPLTADDNTKAYETLRKAIDQRYSYRDLRVKDWDAVFDRVKDGLIAAKSRAAFARTAARALTAAGDVHVSLAVGEARFPTFRAGNWANLDAGLIRQLVPELSKASNIVTTGVFEDGIGYIGIAGWPGDVPSLAPAHAFLDKFKGKALIIDVRANGGGDELAARRFASRFVREEGIYSRNRSRDEQGNWTGQLARTIEPSTEPHYDGPVAVLMGPACVSSNESFLLMMKFGAAARLVGQPSYGSSGNPKPIDLGNGVTVILPSWEDQLPDGTVLEGRGVQPDIAAELGADPARDGVLEAALAALRQQPREPIGVISRLLAVACFAVSLALSVSLYFATGAKLFTQLPSESLASMEKAKGGDDAFAGLGVDDLAGAPAKIDNSFRFGLLPAGPGHYLADSASVVTIVGPALLMFLFSWRRRARV